jgi:hypothetical protein
MTTDPTSAIGPSGLARLSGQAQQQSEAAARQLALTPYEWGMAPGGINPPTNPTAQDRHPSAQRLRSSAWAGKTGQVNHAQAAQDSAPVWVTVPVDKVETRAGSSSVSAVYATPTGYRSRPGESAGSIPPAMPAGRPY